MESTRGSRVGTSRTAISLNYYLTLEASLGSLIETIAF